MIPNAEQLSRQRYARLRSSSSGTASYPLTRAAAHEPRGCGWRPIDGSRTHESAPPRATRHAPITTFLAGTRCGDFVDSVKRANICAVHTQTSDAPGAANPYIGRFELAPTTAVRAHAQTKYSTRFRDAYGLHRPRAGALHCSSTTESSVPRKAKPHTAGLRLSVTSLARPNDSHLQTIPSFSTETLSKPNCAGPRHEGRQEKRSERRSLAIHPNMCEAATRRPE